MRRASRRFLAARSGRPIRGVDWGDAAAGSVIAPLGVARYYAITAPDLRSGFVDPTIMALLLSFEFSVSVPANTSLTGEVCVGVIDWTDADGTPPADGPSPITNGQFDWMLTASYPIAIPLGSSGVIIRYSNTSFGAPDGWVRGKAKRRMGNNKGLLVCIENNTIYNTYCYSRLRYLLKE